MPGPSSSWGTTGEPRDKKFEPSKIAGKQLAYPPSRAPADLRVGIAWDVVAQIEKIGERPSFCVPKRRNMADCLDFRARESFVSVSVPAVPTEIGSKRSCDGLRDRCPCITPQAPRARTTPGSVAHPAHSCHHHIVAPAAQASR